MQLLLDPLDLYLVWLLGLCYRRFEMAGKNRGVIQRPVLVGPVFSLSETVSWLEELAAALDCYNWVFQEQLMSPSEVFQGIPLSCYHVSNQ